MEVSILVPLTQGPCLSLHHAASPRAGVTSADDQELQRCLWPQSRARVGNRLSCFQSGLCPSCPLSPLRLPHHPQAPHLMAPGPSLPHLGPPPLLEVQGKFSGFAEEALAPVYHPSWNE